MTTGAASISSTDLIVLYPQRIPNLKNPFAAGQGGRNNRSAGNYHFHRGPLDGRAYDSKGEGAKALLAYLPGVANEAASEVHRPTNGPLFDLGPPIAPTNLQRRKSSPIRPHMSFNIARPMSRRPRSSTASPPSNYKPALVPPTTSAVTGRSLSKN